MASKKQALAVIAQHGGMVDWDFTHITSGEKHICVDAPAGHYWCGSEAETFTVSWYSGPATEFWDEVIEYASWGVEAS